jgi:hypothetical protein
MRTLDGLELSGGSPDEIVADFHAKAFGPEADDATFMSEVAHRGEQQTGQPIRSDSAANFIADLLAAGLLLDKADEGKPPPPAAKYDEE